MSYFKKVSLFLALIISFGSVTFLNGMKQNETPNEKQASAPEFNFMQPVSYNSNLQEEKFQPNLEEDEHLEKASEIQRLKEEFEAQNQEIQNLKEELEIQKQEIQNLKEIIKHLTTKKKETKKKATQNKKKRENLTTKRLNELRKLKKDNDAKGKKRWWTLLHYAAKYGYVDVMKRLGKDGMNYVTYGRENTALHIAIWNNRIEVVRLLLSWYANPNIINKDKQTPMHLAVECSRIEIVEMLGKAKVRINEKNKWSNTPLGIATKHKDDKIIKMLKGFGAKLSISEKLFGC